MYQMTETEEKFADFVWEHEPVGSGELVKLCGDAFGWKKSTTYTFIKKLCGQGILKNEKAIVTSLITREEYLQGQGGGICGKGISWFTSQNDRRLYGAKTADAGAGGGNRADD